MRQTRLATISPLILGGMTLVGLLLNLPSEALLSTYPVQALLTAFLTFFVLFFAVWVSDTELSPVHAIGMVAFLSMPGAAFPLTLWCVFLGSVAGGYTLQQGRPALTSRRPTLRSVVFIVTRVTLSFLAAGELYRVTAAPLPLESMAWASQFDAVLTLIIYTLVYVTVYFAIYVLQLYAEGRKINAFITNNLVLLMTILVLPVPFAIVSAEFISDYTRLSEIVSLLGLVVIALGLHALSRSEFQLRKQVNELQTISVVTRTVRSHLELDSLLRTVYLQVAHLLNIENFTVVLYHWSRNRLEFPLVMRRGREETGDHDLRVRLYDHALIRHVHDTGTALLIPADIPAEAERLGLEPPPSLPAQSWLGVPLLAGGRILGMIEVMSDNRSLTEDDLRLLNIVVASASIAIENAQLYEQQTARVSQLSTLNNIAALLSGTLSPDTVLDTIISSASALAEANAVAVYLFWDEAKENLPLVRSAGLSTAYTNNPPTPVLRHELHSKMPLAVADVAVNERTQHMAALLKDENKAAIVELPLVIGEDSLGILVLFFNETQTFSGEQLEVFRTFATQAAQAINNARTYATTDEAFQRSVEQLFALADIGRLLTSTIDLRKICRLVLDKAAEATRVDMGAVALYDETSGLLRVMAHTGYPEEIFSNEYIIHNQIKSVALNGQPRRINDVRKADAYLRLVDYTRSQLSVPIKRGQHVLGYVLLESPTLAAFSAEDSNFVSQIANQAVIAIDNARLFDRITEARDRLQVILDTMDEGIILIDDRGKIALANPRIDVIGLEPERILNWEVTALLQDDALQLAQRLGFERKSELEKLVRSLMKDAWSDYEPHLYTHQSGRYIQRLIIPVPAENGDIMGALLIFYDKTEEQELARAREELSRMIVHDLRSPLTAVTTSLKLLQELVPKDADFYTIVDSTTSTSRRAIRKLLGRVDSLLDIAKMQSGRLGIDTDIAEFPELVDNVIAELTPLARELEIALQPEIAADVPLMNIDADKVERLLLNLVDNALKYSPMETAIRIRAYRTRDGDKDVLRTDVIDHGPGVPDDFKASLFDSFVQVAGRQKVRRGVGLGLSFCKLVAEAHGGRIWVEDNPVGGSIFTFTLPITEFQRLPEDTDEFSVL